MKSTVAIALVLSMSSCSSFKMAIPSRFAETSTRMHIKGLTGLAISQKISFGNFETLAIKNGWTITNTSILNKNFSTFLKMDMENSVEDTKNKFSFTLTDGKRIAEIFCQTNIATEQTTFVKDSKWKNSVSGIENFDYVFSANILPVTTHEKEPWQLLYSKKYDAATDTARKFFSMPVATEAGTAANGKGKIVIEPVRVNKYTGKKIKTSTMFYKIALGYELKMDDGVVSIINTLDNEIWISNNLDDNTKFTIACIASALMLGVIEN